MVYPGRSEPNLTAVLHAVSDGDPDALNQLLEAVYADLHRMCANRLSDTPAGQPLQPTELVHEVYLRLIDQTRVNWQNRAQFYAVAARLIRRALIDQIRAAQRLKRGGDVRHEPISHTLAGEDGVAIDLLALEESLTELSRINETAAQIVEMRFFAGQSQQDIAHVLELSERSIRRHWIFAKAWLYRHMGGEYRTGDETCEQPPAE
jgi:RNA polymerase sigma-70 factor (ECF subfamily)